MKLVAVFGLVLGLSSAASAQMTTEELFDHCGSDDDDRANYCAGYIHGAIDVHRTSSAKDRLCLPERGLSTEEAIRLIVRWVDTRPTERKEPARSAITLATTYAYACNDQVKADIERLGIPVYGGQCNPYNLAGRIETEGAPDVCTRIQPLAGWISEAEARALHWEAYYRRVGWSDHDISAIRDDLYELAADTDKNDPSSETSRGSQREYQKHAREAGWTRDEIRKTSWAEFYVYVHTFHGPDGLLETAQRLLKASQNQIKSGQTQVTDLKRMKLSTRAFRAAMEKKNGARKSLGATTSVDL